MYGSDAMPLGGIDVEFRELMDPSPSPHSTVPL